MDIGALLLWSIDRIIYVLIIFSEIFAKFL